MTTGQMYAQKSSRQGCSRARAAAGGRWRGCRCRRPRPRERPLGATTSWAHGLAHCLPRSRTVALAGRSFSHGRTAVHRDSGALRTVPAELEDSASRVTCVFDVRERRKSTRWGQERSCGRDNASDHQPAAAARAVRPHAVVLPAGLKLAELKDLTVLVPG